ncbi:cellulose-binding domain-containing protein [Streptosporangium sp. NBC_01755]|uniref:cellulose binding domain-containing protein n=1 Tax=unclassified Streptosporangium TaxID=2632669 RepID=UPI002DDA0F46|nr:MULTISPECIES: cellulose binding domain-containing protein [unclassified Streptosporangium]WSA23319.1 cellulose-binding domain-containing protein [Streptosporangium sp. NBC_01810]WSC98544.1 cellulose-binding domain-containing protein [Streptosporangium sp. NBC_01755]
MRSRLVGALAAVVLVPTVVAIPGAATAETAGAPTCAATYKEINSWSYWENGARVTDNMVKILIRNTGTSTINEWQLTWTWPGDQKVTIYLAGRMDQSGADVTVDSNGSWNPVKPNATVRQTFIQRGASAVPVPVVTCAPRPVAPRVRIDHVREGMAVTPTRTPSPWA